MIPRVLRGALAVVLMCAGVAGVSVRAQTPASEYAYEPGIGMPGKDVTAVVRAGGTRWIATRRGLVEER